ncbi:MAG: acetyl-CoA carboxylase, carboxyltransferase subunit beta [Bacteroidetes bacterium]|nr:acetyl-CoA carboxylase, carboxyltransferase subunit beta [Bacteroidota bacterium]
MSWFKRVKGGISTTTDEKKEVPEGLWEKCPQCKKTISKSDLRENKYVCPEDGYHFRIGSEEYFNILFDDGVYTELDADLMGADPLKFVDKKPYDSRLLEAQEKTGLKDACRNAVGKMNDIDFVVSCMDFSFIGGSMGSVMGEKIARAIDFAREHRIPVMVISKSGGARMMEAAFSLMQMAKTSAKLALLDREGIPYISLLTDPTTGGVTASFAMLGDFNIAEPGALIGFAGPRVIKETIGKDLPKGFQSAEFVMEHGFVDLIVPRTELKTKLTNLLQLLQIEKAKPISVPRKKKKTAEEAE